jgi:hypothetical protein
MRIPEGFVQAVFGWLLIFAPTLNATEFLVVEPSDPEGGMYIGGEFIRTTGYEFTVGGLPLSVTALGVRDWLGTGLASFHQVGLWNADRILLATAEVSPGPSSSGFRYTALSAPVFLDAGQSYTVGATYLNEDPDRIGLSDVRQGGAAVYNDAVTFERIRFDDSLSGLIYPELVGFPEERGSFGPNVEFEIVPEPSTIVLVGLGLGILVLRGRNVFKSLGRLDAFSGAQYGKSV